MFKYAEVKDEEKKLSEEKRPEERKTRPNRMKGEIEW